MVRQGGFGGPGRRHRRYTSTGDSTIKDSRKTLQRLWSYLGRQKLGLITVFLMVLASSVLNLASPYLLGRGIDAMNLGKGKVDFASLKVTVLLLIGAYLLGTLTTAVQTYIMASVAQNTVRDLRRDLFAKIQTLPIRFFDTRSRGEIMSRSTNDIDNINQILNQSIIQIFSSILMVAGSLFMMFWISPLLTFLNLIIAPVGFLLTRKIAAFTHRQFELQQEALGDLNGYIEETVTGQKVIKAFGREQNVIESFREINKRYRTAAVRAQILSGIVPPLMNTMGNLSFATVAGVGGWLALRGIVSVGNIASLLNYSKQLNRPLNEIADQFNMIQSAVAGAERVFEIMDESSETDDPLEIYAPEKWEGNVVFDDITFGYEKDKPVLKNITMQALPGQTVALVGPTGAGKTTVVNLLMRFYDPDSGKICVDNYNIRQVKKDNIRKASSMVLQDTHLFSDTVMENIRYGRLDATDEEVIKAAQIAGAHSFISHLSQGYDTLLSRDGGNLSQGQRQMLAIARAALANPTILILDEATSNVDTRTEIKIQKAMKILMEGRTSFVIAHRLSTIRDADEIVVINEGRIVERGTHEQLIEKKGFYYGLCKSQQHGYQI